MSSLEPYVLIEKFTGETPLQALERYRSTRLELQNIPMAYAGRLDPMASGQLLVLIGEECKRQKLYHDLDKQYTFSIILNIDSDTYDQLGRITYNDPTIIKSDKIINVINNLSGKRITLPYPPFSAKTVDGKPLHVWTLENRLHEIEIPTKTSQLYQIRTTNIYNVSAKNLANQAISNIDKVSPVTDPRKSLGADFRRNDVVSDWLRFSDRHTQNLYTVIDISCICSSGTYMRSLAKYIGELLNTTAIASNINRTTIGRYRPLIYKYGIWTTRLR